MVPFSASFSDVILEPSLQLKAKSSKSDDLRHPLLIVLACFALLREQVSSLRARPDEREQSAAAAAAAEGGDRGDNEDSQASASQGVKKKKTRSVDAWVCLEETTGEFGRKTDVVTSLCIHTLIMAFLPQLHLNSTVICNIAIRGSCH